MDQSETSFEGLTAGLQNMMTDVVGFFAFPGIATLLSGML